MGMRRAFQGRSSARGGSTSEKGSGATCAGVSSLPLLSSPNAAPACQTLATRSLPGLGRRGLSLDMLLEFILSWSVVDPAMRAVADE
eukprot:3756670-Rhodomonas_salina.2